jgi:hypothetical protein
MIGVPEKSRETVEQIFPQPPGVVEILENLGFVIDHPGMKRHGNVHVERYWQKGSLPLMARGVLAQSWSKEPTSVKRHENPIPNRLAEK